jgi:hypothetical protein
VGTDTNWVKISVGGSQVLAQKADGTLWSWGTGSALGLGVLPIVTTTPQQISPDTWKSFSAGDAGKSFGIKSDGTLWAWGFNDVGQLGDGTNLERIAPWQIGTDSNWEKVYGGAFYTSLATKTDGSVWYWGTNYDGEFGIGTDLDTNFYTSPFQNPDICVTATLSNPSFELSNTVRLYPNPAKDFTTVIYELASKGAVTIEIGDASGRTIWTKTFEAASGKVVLDCSDYAAGYPIVLKQNGVVVAHTKLIVQ